MISALYIKFSILVKLSSNRHAIKNKWVYRIKTNSNGSIVHYKTRLVMKDYLQKANIDYDETFSPVARFESIRNLISIACANDYEIYQFDIKAIFLYGALKEDIYMKPEGYNDGRFTDCEKVCMD